MDHAYWGPNFSAAEIRAAIEASGIAREGYSITELAGQDLAQRAAAIIADGKILGWFQGRAEWGARALGNRSIVADPRRGAMEDIPNRRVQPPVNFLPAGPPVLRGAPREGVW